MVRYVSGVQDTPTGEKSNPETVGALLDEARWILDEERAHGERLDSRLAVLTGFAGLILVLVSPGGLFPVTDVGTVLLEVSYVASLLLLVLVTLLAVSVLFRARIVWLGGGEGPAPSRVGVGDDVLDRFNGELSVEPTIQIELRMIATLVESVKTQRDLNHLRWKRFRQAAITLVGALLLVAVQGILVLFIW